MGLFDMFKSQRDIAKEEIKEVPWLSLDHEELVEDIVERSQAVPVLIFKHSTSCGISRMVLKSFEKNYTFEKNELESYFLDLKKYRSISNKVASHFNIVHESPQVLVIEEGNVIYDASHGAISIEDIKEKLA